MNSERADQGWNPTLEELLGVDGDLANFGAKVDEDLAANARGLCALFRSWSAAQDAGADGHQAHPATRAMAEMALSAMPARLRQDALDDACERALSGGERRARLLPWLAKLGAKPRRELSAKKIRLLLRDLDACESVVALSQAVRWSSLASSRAQVGDPAGLAALEEAGWGQLERQESSIAASPEARELALWAWEHPWVAAKLCAARARGWLGSDERQNAKHEKTIEQAESLALAWSVEPGLAREAVFDALAARAAQMDLPGPIAWLDAQGHRPGEAAMESFAELFSGSAKQASDWGEGVLGEVVAWVGPLPDAGLGDKALGVYAKNAVRDAWEAVGYLQKGSVDRIGEGFLALERLSALGPGVSMSSAAWTEAAESIGVPLKARARQGEAVAAAEALEIKLSLRAEGVGRSFPRLPRI